MTFVASLREPWVTPAPESQRQGHAEYMPPGNLTRRLVLLLPLAIAACGREPEPIYDPLRYNYLPPIQLNVASIEIEQRFIPAGVAPDVSNQDPVPPIAALTAMANDRLQAFGTARKAIFAILDASLTRENDAVLGSMEVELEYQIRHNLKDMLTNGAAPDTPVEQAPLDETPAR
jgi:hypothetical protein